MMLLLHGVPVGTVKVGETGSVTCQSANAVETKNSVTSDSFLIFLLRGIKKDRLSGLKSGRDREGVLPGLWYVPFVGNPKIVLDCGTYLYIIGIVVKQQYRRLADSQGRRRQMTNHPNRGTGYKSVDALIAAEKGNRGHVLRRGGHEIAGRN